MTSIQSNISLSRLYSKLKEEFHGLNQQVLCNFLLIEFGYSISSGHLSKLKKFDVSARYRRDIRRDKYDEVRGILVTVLENSEVYREKIQELIDGRAKEVEGRLSGLVIKTLKGESELVGSVVNPEGSVRSIEGISKSVEIARAELANISKQRIYRKDEPIRANYELKFLATLDDYLWSLPDYSCVLSLSSMMVDGSMAANLIGFNVEKGFSEFVRKRNGRLKHLFLISSALDRLSPVEAQILCNHLRAYGLSRRLTGTGVYVLELTDDNLFGIFSGDIPVSWLAESGGYTKWEFISGRLGQIDDINLNSNLGRKGYNREDDFFDVLMVKGHKLTLDDYKHLKKRACSNEWGA